MLDECSPADEETTVSHVVVVLLAITRTVMQTMLRAGCGTSVMWFFEKFSKSFSASTRGR